MTIYTINEQITQAVVALAMPIVQGGVYRSREAALARSEGPAILIHKETEDPETRSDRITMRDFVLEFLLIARGQIPDQDADPIHAALHAAIMADPTLGGLVYRVIAGKIEWKHEIADMNAVGVKLLYRFVYLANSNSLTSQP